MELHYCEKCGLRIPEDELGHAAYVDSRYICVKCRPVTPKIKARESTLNAPKVGSNPRLASIPHPSAPVRTETTVEKRAAKQISKTTRESSPPVLLFAAAGGTVFLVGIILMLSGRTNPTESRSAARSSPPESRPAPLSMTRKADPPRDTPARPVSPLMSAAESTRTAPVTNPIPPPTAAINDAEREAQTALEKLIRFEDLNETDFVGRISRLQIFIDQNSQFKVARRATLMLEQFKSSQATVSRPVSAAVPAVPALQVAQAPEPAAPPANVPAPAVIPQPVPPAPELTAQPAKPAQAEESAAARDALGAFESELLELLRKLDAKAATARMSAAEAAPVLAAQRDRLATYKRAAAILSEIEKDILAGIEKLKEVDTFELRASRGEPMIVGKRGKFQMLEFKRDVMQLGSQGMSIPMPLERLEKNTRIKLALLAQPRNAGGVLKSAFLNLLNDDPARTSAVAELKSFNSQAKASGVSAEDVQLVQQLAEIIDRDRLETAAARGWASIQKDADASRWKKVREDIAVLNTQFAASRFLSRNAEAIRALQSKAIDKIEPSFYRAINVNGPPLVIDNQQWEGKDAPNFRVDGNPLESQEIDLEPATDANRARMLRSFCYNRNGSNLALLNVPNGTYSVFLYVWEDNDSQTFNILLKDKVVRENYSSGARGHWEKLGPWKCEVSDGTIEIKCTQGDANLSGIEVWRLPSLNLLR